MISEQKIIFGTDGWRGLLETEINSDTVAEAAQAFADYLISEKKDEANLKAAIGYDGRKSSKNFALIFARVLSGNNITAFLSDKIEATPVLSFYVKENKLDAGVMITASHNPAIYNGIKFKASYGGPFFTEETLKVEKLLGKNEIKKSDGHILQVDLRQQYFDHLENLIDFDSIRKANLNILIDSMSGAGQQIIESLCWKHNIKCTTIYKIAEPDFSGRSAEPIEKNLEPLREELQKGNYSIGLATDGDADRLGVMLGNGEWLNAQETILCLSDYIVNNKKISGEIVKTSSVTDKLRTLARASNRKLNEVQVGFKYICEEMVNSDVAFGCEESGGYGYKNHIPERDGIFSGLIMIEMLAKSGFKNLEQYVSTIRKKYGEIYYDRIDFEYSGEGRLDRLPKLFKSPPLSIDGFEIISYRPYNSSRGIINGIKFTLAGNTRWLLIRASETEPLIRIYAEGESAEEVQILLNEGKKFFF